MRKLVDLNEPREWVADIGTVPLADRDGKEVVAETWKELGFSIAAVSNRIFVRTDPPIEKTGGGLWLPPELTGNYGRRVGSEVLVTATVLSVGPLAKSAVEKGDTVVFPRLNFGWTHKLEDGTLVGWIPDREVFGKI